jgi:signal peptidase I
MSEFVPPPGGETPQVSEPVGHADVGEAPVTHEAAPSQNGAAPPGQAGPPTEYHQQPAAEEQPPADQQRRRQLHPLVELVLILACAFGLWYVVNGWVVKPYRIPSASMEPTLMVGDRVLVSRFIYRFHPPHRFDIVVFHPPGTGDLAEKGVNTEASVTYIKRVIGLPGETVIVKPHSVTVCAHGTSGCHVLDESFLPSGTVEGTTGTYVVPQGDYFMMGDNRGDSQDSRSWGPLPRSYIIGEAFATYWPVNRIRTL